MKSKLIKNWNSQKLNGQFFFTSKTRVPIICCIVICQGRYAVSEGVLGLVFIQLLVYSVLHNVHVPHVAVALVIQNRVLA